LATAFNVPRPNEAKASAFRQLFNMKGAKFVSSVPQWSRVRVVREGSPEKALVKGGEDLDQVFDENEVEHR
jgi:hypothetical protein